MPQYVSYAVISFSTLYLSWNTWRSLKNPSRLQRILAAWRPTHLFYAAPLLVVIVSVAVGLAQLGPVFTWSWWSAIGGQGNMIFGQSSQTGPLSAILLPVIGLFLLVGIPRLALIEEKVFRRGIETRSRAGRVFAALNFGLIHAIVGVPLCACLALAIGGLYLNAVYLRAYRAGRRFGEKVPDLSAQQVQDGARDMGTYVATAAHATYNYLAVGLAFAAFAF